MLNVFYLQDTSLYLIRNVIRELYEEGFSPNDIKVLGNFISCGSLFPVRNPTFMKMTVVFAMFENRLELYVDEG